MPSRENGLWEKGQSPGHSVPERKLRNTGNLAMSAGYVGNIVVGIQSAMTALCWHFQEV